MAMLSSKASHDSHGQDSSYFFGWQEYEKNPYHPTRNPTGIIQMGLAENELSFDLLEEWLEKNPEALGLRRNGESVFRELALFQDYNGYPALKKELVELMSEIRGNKVKFDVNKLVLTAGATSANEILMFCLAKPGEAFLVPTPYYPGFDRDLKWRTGVQIVPIHSSSSNGFRMTAAAMEEAFKEAEENQKLRVKGILITNPSNPLGTTMRQEEIDLVVKFATAKGIHIVSDEIYSATVFESPRFISIMEGVRESSSGGIWNRIHVVYSLSKDLGLPGFRVGMIYSNDNNVVGAATKMSSFGLMSSQTQYLVSQMLGDGEFRGNYMEENKRRIRERKGELVSGLRKAGIGCLKSNAGLFCWVDMRHLLKSPASFQEEMVIWKRILCEVGINVSPGSACHCSEPGWFRMCFANMSQHTLTVAMRRLKAFVQS